MTEPMHLSFLDYLIWHGPTAVALVLLVLAIVVPILRHVGRAE